MRIAIFGLGYVGSVSAACLAAAGHEITGVDVDQHKLALIRGGRAPISEPGLDDLMARMVASSRLNVTDDAAAAIRSADLTLICVGTPSHRSGSLDTTFLERSLAQIGAALAVATSYHVIAIRSTLLPGLLESRLIPLLESASGRQAGVHFGVCVNPEFLREGTAIHDFEHPPFTVIGASDNTSADLLASIYRQVQAPVYRVLPDEASMVKYASNAFHAMKVAFGNEIGAVCHRLGIDGSTVMRLFCEDRELNISPRYLRPGFAFGGSCLPKDLRAMVYATKAHDINAPLLRSVLDSNDAHLQRVIDTVLELRKRRVALLGLSFKVGSDDLRESPFVRLAEALIGKGISLTVYDPDVALGGVFGRNLAYVEAHLPHIQQLMIPDLSEAVRDADVIVVGKHFPEIAGIQDVARGQTYIDLVGVPSIRDAIRPWASSRATIGAGAP